VLGLLTAADGEPLAVRVFQGNTTDGTPVATQIEIVKQRFRVTEVVFVGDRGRVKATGKTALTTAGLKYITALTDPQVRKLLKNQVIPLDRFDEIAQEVDYGELRLVLRRNAAVRCQAAHRRQDKLDQLQRLLDERTALVAPSKRAQPAAGLGPLKRWAQRHQRSAFVTLALQGTQLSLTLDEAKQADVALVEGCYVVETDVAQDNMEARTVEERYRDLQKVERDLRTMTTALLEVRPIFVRQKSRTWGHVFVAMLALQLARTLEGRLKTAFGTSDQGDSALSLQDALHALSRLCFQRHAIGGQTFLTLPRADQNQERIVNALKVRLPSINPWKPATM
jgi:transposase